jgi:hypothetical protein
MIVGEIDRDELVEKVAHDVVRYPLERSRCTSKSGRHRNPLHQIVRVLKAVL